MYNGVKVFTATMIQDRANLGDKITAWLSARQKLRLVDVVVTQSSDSAFHCLSITVFYFDPDA
jgi:hypothetical protein